MEPTPNRYAVKLMAGLETYQIGREAIITLQPSTGYIAVSCPHHDELNGCHWWTHRGSLSLHEFLLGLDRDYVLMKLFAYGSLDEYDEDATKAAFREDVMRHRRSGDLDKDAARHIWNQIDDADGPEDIARVEGVEEPYDFIRNRPKVCADWFWDHVWSAFIKHIKHPHNP